MEENNYNEINHKLSMKIWRIVSINTQYLLAAARIDDVPQDEPITYKELDKALNDRFRPFHPAFKLFSSMGKRSTVGMPALEFDLNIQTIPIAGIVDADPLDAEEIKEIDGKIIGELERMGIPVDGIEFNWYASYELR